MKKQLVPFVVAAWGILGVAFAFSPVHHLHHPQLQLSQICKDHASNVGGGRISAASHATQRRNTQRHLFFNKAIYRMIGRSEKENRNNKNKTDTTALQIQEHHNNNSSSTDDTNDNILQEIPKILPEHASMMNLSSTGMHISGSDNDHNLHNPKSTHEAADDNIIHAPPELKEQQPEAMELDVLSPVFFSANIQDNLLDNQQGQLSEEFHDALELLGPMTLSDPAFKLGINPNETASTINWVVSNDTTSPDVVVKGTSIPRKNSKGSSSSKKKTYTPRPSILEANKFFTTLPPFFIPSTTVLNSNNNNKNNSTTNVTTLLTPAIFLANGSKVPYYPNYDTKAALAFLDSQANFTKQQMETVQKMLWETSTNASKQLDSAQKAFLQYGTQVLGEAVATTTNSNNNNRGSGMSVEELEAYLRLNGYVKQDDLQPSSTDAKKMPLVVPRTTATASQVGRGRRRVMTRSSGGFQSVADLAVDTTTTTSTTTPSKSGASSSSVATTSGRRVAFPQPSVLSYAKLKWGCTVSASLLGLLGGITIVPSLWLLGAIFGGLYGYETTKNLAERPPTHALSKGIVYLGRSLTLQYLKIRDFVAGLWFMYKTGQLSYDYWKKYAALDQQFAIQSKIDAWNARFQKGKENFDLWEQENEVGRKILAGLRTVWLVEEKSFKKSSTRFQQSRYRIVQYCFNAWRYVKLRVLNLYAKRGQALKELQAFSEGMRQELVDPSQWQEKVRPRIAASLAALTFVNLTGALFAASPLLLGVAAVVLGGIVWPTWFSEWLRRVGVFFEETTAKGKGETQQQKPMELLRGTLSSSSTTGGANNNNSSKKQTGAQPVMNDLSKVFSWPFMSENEKERYDFYKRPDGSKKWYRTGSNPWDIKSALPKTFWKQDEPEEKPWWSLN